VCVNTGTHLQDVLRLDRSDATCSNLKVNVAERADGFLRIIIVIDIIATSRDNTDESSISKDSEVF